MDTFSNDMLIASDPVSVARFMDNAFHAVLDFLCSDDNPIGKVIHYFWRREYQKRGTEHYHLLIWIENAPVSDESALEEVAAFVQKYVTCRIPDKRISPVLFDRVVTHQKHSHNPYCLRNKKKTKLALSANAVSTSHVQ